MKIHALGTGGALTTERRVNTSIAIESDEHTLLLECAGTPVHALRKAGLDWMNLTDIVITHRHPDHLYALPSLALHIYVECLAMSRSHSLTLYGPEDALAVASQLMDAVDLSHRKELQLSYVPLPLKDHATVIGELHVATFPVSHGDVCALGVEVKRGAAEGGAMVFSGDTSPCDTIVEHARGADLLFHECSSVNEEIDGHTSLAQINEMARLIEVPRIILVHLPPLTPLQEGAVRRRLRAEHGGRIQLGEDGMAWEL